MRQVFPRFMALVAVVACSGAPAWAGPYAPAAGQTGSDAVFKDSTLFTAWATGYQNYLPGPNVDSTFQTPNKALGKAVGDSFDVVSLGDAGQITLSFAGLITNGTGWDFAVFENSFNDTFLELAYVEVSADGSTFYRFPNFSLTSSPVGSFGAVDPTNIYGLAGKYRQGYGTPFNLDDLALVYPSLNVATFAVRYVRLVDIVGNGGQRDTLNRRIYDPYPTSLSSGFDLDAVGVRYLAPDSLQVPMPGPGLWILSAVLGLLGMRIARRSSEFF